MIQTMYRILSLAFVIYTCFNATCTEGSKMKQCHYCRSEDMKECLPQKMQYHDCNYKIDKCISFAGLNKEKNTPLFYRGCFPGDCHVFEKHNKELEAVHCKSCDKSKCNNEKLPHVMPKKASK